jgi:hypothetical protein
VIAAARRQPGLALALPVIVLAGAPLVQLADVVLTLVLQRADVPQFAASWLAYVVPAWFVAMIVRATWVAFEGEGTRRLSSAIAAGALLAAPTWLSPSLFPALPWWYAESPLANAGAGASPVSELVQAAQRQLLDDALDALADERPGVVDLYFVGFAADARESGLREEIEHARQVMDERWDTRGRSLVLANDPAALLETPFATVTNLRDALREIGSALDPDSDVVMVYVAGRGGDGGVEVAHPPLDLLPVEPSALRALLDDAGIRWRIVVVSACRAAPFQALADERTVVLTSDDSCTDSTGANPLGDPLFADGLGRREVFSDALNAAAAASKANGGKPTLAVGAAIADVLKAFDRRGAARHGRTV